jgi:hypothetical protein
MLTDSTSPTRARRCTAIRSGSRQPSSSATSRSPAATSWPSSGLAHAVAACCSSTPPDNGCGARWPAPSTARTGESPIPAGTIDRLRCRLAGSAGGPPPSGARPAGARRVLNRPAPGHLLAIEASSGVCRWRMEGPGDGARPEWLLPARSAGVANRSSFAASRARLGNELVCVEDEAHSLEADRQQDPFAQGQGRGTVGRSVETRPVVAPDCARGGVRVHLACLPGPSRARRPLRDRREGYACRRGSARNDEVGDGVTDAPTSGHELRSPRRHRPPLRVAPGPAVGGGAAGNGRDARVAVVRG